MASTAMPDRPPPSYQQHQQPIEAFPSDLPPRPQPSFKDRNCPNMRTCWSFSWRAYSLRHTGSKTKLWRRLSMILILFFRFVISVFNMLFGGYGRINWIASVTIGAIFLVLGFLSFAWCLAVIGEAEGRRKVLGVYVGRKHLDVFIHVSAFIHAVMLTTLFVAIGTYGATIWWNFMWIITAGYAWVATWPPEQSVEYPIYQSGGSYATREAAEQPDQAV